MTKILYENFEKHLVNCEKNGFKKALQALLPREYIHVYIILFGRSGSCNFKLDFDKFFTIAKNPKTIFQSLSPFCQRFLPHPVFLADHMANLHYQGGKTNMTSKVTIFFSETSLSTGLCFLFV